MRRRRLPVRAADVPAQVLQVFHEPVQPPVQLVQAGRRGRGAATRGRARHGPAARSTAKVRARRWAPGAAVVEAEPATAAGTEVVGPPPAPSVTTVPVAEATVVVEGVMPVAAVPRAEVSAPALPAAETVPPPSVTAPPRPGRPARPAGPCCGAAGRPAARVPAAGAPVGRAIVGPSRRSEAAAAVAPEARGPAPAAPASRAGLRLGAAVVFRFPVVGRAVVPPTGAAEPPVPVLPHRLPPALLRRRFRGRQGRRQQQHRGPTKTRP
jgi:hypothetical protein